MEYEDVNSPAIDVGFRVVDNAALSKAFGIPHPNPLPEGEGVENVVYAVIWTTTPWTLPANQAVSVHPEFDYDLIQTSKGLLILAHELAPTTLARYGETDTKLLASCKGSALKGLQLQHPFDNRQVPIICGDHVTTEAGTGLVHTAAAHGNDDWLVMKANFPNEKPRILMGGDGKFFNSDLVEFEAIRGLTRQEANKVILAKMLETGNLLASARLNHSFPHCWRHKTPLMQLATHQWFMGMEYYNPPFGIDSRAEAENNNSLPSHSERELRAIANQAVENTEFFPSWGRARLEAMIKNRPDWCVSRQRNWGVPMGLFVHKELGTVHPETHILLEKACELVEKRGVEAWFSLGGDEFLKEHSTVDNKLYKKVTYTLDVWFDSGATHYAVLRSHPAFKQEVLSRLANKKPAADLYLEGSDQHRGWFQSSLLTGCAIDGHAPYEALLTHGFVVDGNGYKMSKSKGNVVAPQKVMDTYGADILRLWAASTDYSGELTISDEILKRVADSYRKIRNTCKFLLANIADFDVSKDLLPVEEWLEIDRYALHLTQKLQDDVLADYDRYEFHLAVQKLVSFCSDDLGAFYLDILKDRLYTSGKNSFERRAAQSALHHITHTFMRLITPILSFTADEIWAALNLGEDKSVFEELWYELPEHALSKKEISNWLRLIEIRSSSNKVIEDARTQGLIGSSLQIELDIFLEGTDLSDLSRLGEDLRFVFITSRATIHSVEKLNIEDLDDTAKSLMEITELRRTWVRATPSQHTKCERCWHYVADVGSDAEHPTICKRCVTNLFGKPASRKYA